MPLSIQESFFLDLLRAGLWGSPVTAVQEPDWAGITALARSQAVAGIVSRGMGVYAAQLEGVSGGGLSSDEENARWMALIDTLNPLMASAMKAVRRNAAMDKFLASMQAGFKRNGITALVVKGQSVGHLYADPSLRQSGDIDLLLDRENYGKAKEYLAPRADSVEKEGVESLHQGFRFGKWPVELHGTLHAGLNRRTEAVQDRLQAEMFAKGEFRTWECEGEEMLSPPPLFDAVFILLHVLQHIYHEGIGFRQFCDWAVHMHRFSGEIDRGELERWIDALGIREEWTACASLAVDHLGLPAEEMPLYDPRHRKRGDKLCRAVFLSGNFGVNLENPGKLRRSLPVRKLISLWETTRQNLRLFGIFPKGVARTYRYKLYCGFKRIYKK